MTPLTLDDLRTLARAQGLALTEDELSGLLPLVQAGRDLTAGLDPVLPGDVEPASQYRIA